MRSSPFSPQTLGLLIFISATLAAPAMDSIAKLLADQISATQVAFIRFALQVIILIIFIAFMPTKAKVMPKSPLPTILIGTVLASALVIYFTSLKWLPLADATAIFFIEPLCLTVMSHWFLGEHVGWRRYLAILVGLLGAVIVIRPSFAEFGWPAVLPAIAALLAASYMILTSKLTRSEHPLTIQLSSGLGGFLFLGAILIWGSAADIQQFTFIWPDLRQWVLLILAALIGVALAVGFVYALKLSKASFLAPFGYFEIVSAVILSAVLFNEIPDLLTWLGISIIIGSGLFVLWRERATRQL